MNTSSSLKKNLSLLGKSQGTTNLKDLNPSSVNIDEMSLFNCSKDFLQSIYGDKYCRRICSEIEMTSILTLLWISLEGANIKHEFREKEELYQYLRETFKIKTPDKMNPTTIYESDESEKSETISIPLPAPAPAPAPVQVPAKIEAIHGSIVVPIKPIPHCLQDFTTTLPKIIQEPEEDEAEEEVQTENPSEYLDIEEIVAPFISYSNKGSVSDNDSESDSISFSESEKEAESPTSNQSPVDTIPVETSAGTATERIEDSTIDTEIITYKPESELELEPESPYEKGVHPRIAELLAIPQPEQKSLAWLSQRQDYITASVFGASTGFLGPASLVNLLLDKVSRGKLNPFHGNQATQWGEKYEPITNDVYCYRMKSQTYEFGMIPHPNKEIGFLGASTDGIAVKDGKLTNIEIKSPFSRFITGIPKPEYWAQMQLQMEILDLDETHFIESKFREYDDIDEFWRIFEMDIDTIDHVDPYKENEEERLIREYDAEGDSLALYESDHLARIKAANSRSLASKLQGDQVTYPRKVKREERGLMIEAICLDKEENDGSPKRLYISSPIKLYKNATKLRSWYAAKLNELKNSTTTVYLRTNGWIAERFSCVHVERDKAWFKNQIDVIQSFWSDVIKYREMNLSLEKIAQLKEPLTNKYRSYLATKNLNSKPKQAATKKSTAKPRSKMLDDDDEVELPFGLSGCMIDNANSGNNSNPNSGLRTPIKVSAVSQESRGILPGLGFGCLLDSTSISNHQNQVPQKISSMGGSKKKVNQKFF